MNNYKHITGGTTNPLISKFTTGGEVPSSDPPKQYAETALERVENYDVNTDPNAYGFIRDYFGKPNKVTPENETPEAKKARLEAMSFLRSWYTHPTTQQMVAAHDNRRNYELGVRTPNGKVVTYPEDARRVIISGTLSNTPVQYTDQLPERTAGRHTFRSYDPSNNLIEMNTNYSHLFRPIFTHEYVHALSKAIPGLATPTQKVVHRLNPGAVRDPNYADTPQEIIAKIMAFRQYHKLDPGKRDYTPEEAAEMQKKTEDIGDIGGGIIDLNRLAPETLADYLNYLANANTSTNRPTYQGAVYAKRGGYVPKHQRPAGGITLVGGDRRKGLKERVKAWWNDLPKDYSDGMCALDAKGNPTGNCAKYSNDVLKKQGYTSIGDAWTRVPFSGAKVLYSGYDKNLPKEFTDSAYWAYMNGVADKVAPLIDPSTLQDYDMVSLMAQGSTAVQEAYNEGKKHGRIHTHTGHIRIGDDGERYVVHNVHNKLYQHKLSDLMGGNRPFSVVEIARPKK